MVVAHDNQELQLGSWETWLPDELGECPKVCPHSEWRNGTWFSSGLFPLSPVWFRCTSATSGVGELKCKRDYLRCPLRGCEACRLLCYLPGKMRAASTQSKGRPEIPLFRFCGQVVGLLFFVAAVAVLGRGHLDQGFRDFSAGRWSHLYWDGA